MPPLISPDAESLRLGAGNAYFDRWDANGVSTGFRHIGNLESLDLTITPDILIVRSTMSKARPVYKKFTRAIDSELVVKGQEWTVDNLAMMFMGDVAYATQAATPVVDQLVKADIPATPVATLGSQLGGKVFFVGALNIGTVSMKLGATALGVGDFTVENAGMGLIKILPGSTAVTDGAKDLLVSFTPQAITGTESPVVRGGSQSEVQGSFMFVEDNTAGENHIFRAWSVSATPDGAMGLISADPATFSLKMAVQDDSAGLHGGSVADPLFHCQLVPAAA